MQAIATVDTTNLNLLIEASLQFSKRTAIEAINNAAYWTTRNAYQAIDAVPIGVIDSELKVSTVPRLTTRGKPSKRRKNFVSGTVPFGGGMVPIAALIVSARANPSSRYNALTNNRWLISKNPFAGVSKQDGQKAMAKIIHKMIASRHSSSGFIRSGWIPALRTLGPLVQNKFRAGYSPVYPKQYLGNQTRGDAIPAHALGWVITAAIENDTGGAGVNSAAQNQALWTHGAPALNAAIAAEETRTLDYIRRKMNNPNWIP